MSMRRAARIVAVSFVALAIGTVGRSLLAEAPPFSYQSQYVAMRDGVRIAVDVYLPRARAANERVPAILHQTRYYRAFDVRWPASALFGGMYDDRIRLFTTHGYAYVLVDVRGSGASFGVRSRPWSPEEVDDGVQLVDWIRRQPWSNGDLGSLGWSYDGTSSEFLAARSPVGLRAIAPQFAPYDGYRDVAFPGGIHLTTLTAFFEHVTAAMDRNRLGSFLGFPASLALKGIRPVDADTDGALLDAAIQAHTNNEHMHRDALAAEFRGDANAEGLTADAVSSLTQTARFQSSGVAIYNWSGWYDGALARSAIDRFAYARTAGSHLILGPWSHTGRKNLSPFGEAPLFFDADAELLRFFDRYVRGIKNGFDRLPPVRYFTMGDERWRWTATWPPAGVRWQSYLLGRDGTMRTADGGFPAEADSLNLLDADAGQRTRWDAMIAGDQRQVEIGERTKQNARLPIYHTAPLARDVEVTGQPVITFFLVSSKPDAELFVYLDDVDDRGVAHSVSEGMLRLIHRLLIRPGDDNHRAPAHSFLRRDAAPMRPDRAEEISIDLLPTSYVFRRGHQIQIAIAGGDTAHFREMAGPPQPVTILIGGTRPSRVDLPVASR